MRREKTTGAVLTKNSDTKNYWRNQKDGIGSREVHISVCMAVHHSSTNNTESKRGQKEAFID